MPHFEYIAMELLGPDLNELVTGPVAVVAVARVLLQLVRFLLWSMQDDPSKIVLIDFGLSKPFKSGSPEQRESFNEDGLVIGTIMFASLNAHYGFTWALRSIRSKNDTKMIGYLKLFPTAFGYLLDYSRKLENKRMPAYASLRQRFKKLISSVDKPSMRKALDWSPTSLRQTSSRTKSNVDVPERIFDVIMLDGNANESYFHLFMSGSDITGPGFEITIPDVDACESHVDAPVPNFYDSYGVVDNDYWIDNKQREDRHKALTLPSEQKEEANSKITTFSLSGVRTFLKSKRVLEVSANIE
ncbi:hypothetical protein BDQ17DRAFT_1322748 [Cyathus striatus]|nr:hypothetical protein BDQ17DRAFT_1322748 [Cyathus striatus]